MRTTRVRQYFLPAISVGSVLLVLVLSTQMRARQSVPLMYSNRTTQTSSDSKLSRLKSLVIWNTDFHPSPAADIRGFLEPLGVRVLQHAFSYYCAYFDVCSQGNNTVKLLTSNNYARAHESQFRAEFYAAYKDDPVMKSVDAFLCTDVVAICQLYMQYNKTIIIVATSRYYGFRDDFVNEHAPRWQQWTDDLKLIASNPRNIIAANNLYDVNFIRYFTGIEPHHIPSYCGYTNASYNPSKPVYMMYRGRTGTLENQLRDRFNAFCNNITYNCSVKLEFRDGKHGFSHLASYRGIVHVPYQISTMSIFEQYRMNIPLFFPSMKLLVDWDLKHWILKERTHPGHVRGPRTPPHDKSQDHLPSPHDEHSASALEYWLQFADFYTLPHIQYFESEEHLTQLLNRLTVEDVRSISHQMMEYNAAEKAKLTKKWTDIMLHVASHTSKNYTSTTPK